MTKQIPQKPRSPQSNHRRDKEILVLLTRLY